MKPQFERVTLPQGCSIRVYHRQVPEIPFEWHHHPEYELTLTRNSRGWRFIGDHIGAYRSHDLVLVPSDMPHTWASTAALDPALPHSAVVVWFTREWALRLADTCPEFAPVRTLLKRSGAALSFTPPSAALFESRLPALLSDEASERLQAALSILLGLASAEAAPLATVPAALGGKLPPESAQLNRVLDLLHARFSRQVRMRDLCAAGNLSARSLHRLFVRHLGENLSTYLNRLRIGRACMLLAETDRPVSMIAGEAGYANLANFNRQFRKLRRMTPREFRSYFLQHGSIPRSAQENALADLSRRSPSLQKSMESRRAI